MSCGYPTSLLHLRQRQQPLKFRADGTFRILHMSDIHLVAPQMDRDDPEHAQLRYDETLKVIEKCVAQADPDLVVFGGDNICGYWDTFTYEYMVSCLRAIVAPIAARNIPLTVVFGNHDSEGEEVRPFERRENQVSVYAEYANFRGCYNDADVHGCCNCCLPILSADGKKTAWAVWCIDSNDYDRNEDHLALRGCGYDTVHPDQIAWYEQRSAELQAENGGKPVPSVLFQHIPVNQEWDIVEEAQEGDSDTFGGGGGKRFRAKPGSLSAGKMREYPCPPAKDRAQFESWVKTGNMVAAFFGHDHVNSFTYEREGIKLIQTIGTGYFTYGAERGGRLIVLHDGTKSLDTETIVIPPENDAVKN